MRAAVFAAVLLAAVRVEHVTAGTIYKYFDDRKTWSQAEATCVASGGHLASIGSQTESAAVFETAHEQCSSDGYDDAVWIGLNDLVTTNSYKWTDATSSVFRNWNAGEPSHGENEHCVFMYTCGTGFAWSYQKWNDVPCNALLHFVCEIQQSPVLTPNNMSKSSSTSAARTTSKATAINPSQMNSMSNASSAASGVPTVSVLPAATTFTSAAIGGVIGEVGALLLLSLLWWKRGQIKVNLGQIDQVSSP
jgi:hypothetical protein